MKHPMNTAKALQAEINKLERKLEALQPPKRQKTKIVTNLMSGRLCRIPVNTPLCCDPSSETYWSM